ncbi:MAG: phage holin family protein [Clostridia bacterium]
MEMLSVPIIATLVLALLEIIKVPFKDKPKFNNFIPLIAGVLGILLGIVAFYAAPTLIPTTNIFHAILVGFLSGLSATGSHQLVKQIFDSKK